MNQINQTDKKNPEPKVPTVGISPLIEPGCFVLIWLRFLLNSVCRHTYCSRQA